MTRYLILLATLAACSSGPFDAPVTLGGRTYASAELNRGYHLYRKACRACHGDLGDGHGVSAQGLWPPPRDLRQGLYKFTRVPAPGLPPDEELARIVRFGLTGTAMLPWTVGDHDLDALLGYVKTFSPRWRTDRAEPAVIASADPYSNLGPEALLAVERRGEALYHGKAMCSTCHPSYVTRARLFAITAEMGGTGVAAYSDTMYASRIKETEYCWRWHPLSPGQKLDDRTCDEPVRAVPPDFLRDPLRAVRADQQLRDLYLTLAGGIAGAGMPPWKGVLPDDELWAMSYYLRSLLRLQGTPRANELTDPLRLPANREWMPPP